MSEITPLDTARYRLERAMRNLEQAKRDLINAEIEALRCQAEVDRLTVLPGRPLPHTTSDPAGEPANNG